MKSFFPTYYLKTALHAVTPGGFGYYRRLRKHQNPAYNHERDKHPVRTRHNRTSGWKDTVDVLHKREYENYDEYRTHQVQKYQEILQTQGGFGNYTVFTWRQKFFHRFQYLSKFIPLNATIVCLGARQGTEVEVLWDMGFKNAYGLDLNPGPDNPYVRPGDFMHLQEKDNSVDVLYTNCVDHAFDLDSFLAEQCRVLKPNGFGLYDLPLYSGTRKPGAFEAIGWNSEEEIISRLKKSFKTVLHTRTEKKWMWILLQNPVK